MFKNIHFLTPYQDLRTKLSSEPEEVGLRCPLCTGKITLAGHQEIHKFYCQVRTNKKIYINSYEIFLLLELSLSACQGNLPH